MFVLTEPVYPRRKVEKWFKQLYNLGLVLNFSAFVITITSFVVRLSSTYKDFFGNTEFTLAPGLATMLNGCPATPATFKQNHVTATSSLDTVSSPFVFLTTTNLILGIIVVHGLLIVFDFLAKLLFTLNVRHLRVRGLHFPLHTTLVLGAIACSILVITLIAASESTRDFVQNYVEVCAQRYQLANQDEFVNTENDTEVVFGTSFVLILVAVCINLFAYICAAFTYMSDASRGEAATLVREQYPWEKGLLCKPDKPILKAWSRWRRAQEQAVKDGQPRDQNPALPAISAAALEEERERQRVLTQQLAANELSRDRKRLPPSLKESRQARYQANQYSPNRGASGADTPRNRGAARRHAPSTQNALPAEGLDDVWEGDEMPEGDEFVGEYDYAEGDGVDYGDGVGADYVEPDRRRRRHRKDARDPDREARRRRRRRERYDDQDAQGATDAAASTRADTAYGRSGDHAIVPMQAVEAPSA